MMRLVRVRDTGAVPGTFPWDEGKHKRQPSGMGRQSGEFATMGNAQHPNSIERGMGHSITTGVSPGGSKAVALYNKIKGIVGGKLHSKAVAALAVAPEGVPIQSRQKMPVNTGTVPDQSDYEFLVSVKASLEAEYDEEVKPKFDKDEYVALMTTKHGYSESAALHEWDYYYGGGKEKLVAEHEQAQKIEADIVTNASGPEDMFKMAQQKLYYSVQQAINLVMQKYGEAGLEKVAEINIYVKQQVEEQKQLAKQMELIEKERKNLLASHILADVQEHPALKEDADYEFYDRLHGAAAEFRSDAQRRHVTEYTGNDYQGVNSFLRYGGDASDRSWHKEERSIREWIKRSELPTDLTVFRGVNASYAAKLLEAAAPGQEFQDKGFMSTTVSLEQAVERAIGGGALLRIDAKQGQRGGYVGQFSYFPDEEEVVMQAGSRLRVKDVDRERRIIHMELVQHEEEIHPKAPRASQEKGHEEFG